MKTQKDPMDVADALASDLDYLRTLLCAAEDKVRFYLSNRNLLGSCNELLALQARELDGLLALAERFLGKMEQEMDTVTDLLYEMNPPPTV